MLKMPTFLALLVTLLVAAPAATPASAAEPTATILRVDGLVAGGKPVTFDRAALEKLGTATIRTATPWHDGVQTFEGVPLDTLLTAVGASGKKLIVAAINKYQVEIPAEDAKAHKVLLALKRNGQIMDVKDKGPIFVIYPFDDKPELRSELYYGRAVWQVRSITVE